jgi:uncharacterized membrane protein YbhN (UPF0104 family)
LPILGLAFAVVAFDLAVRAARWQTLLRAARGGAGTPLRLALGYLSIGYLANQLLPARTGDLARAYLAGRAFGLPRLATLGTIVVERVADAGTILGLALVAGLVIAGVDAVNELTAYALVVGGAGLMALLVSWLLLDQRRFGNSRLGGIARSFSGRLWAGMRGLRSVRGALAIAATTVAATATAVAVAWLVTAAIGVTLSPVQAVLFLSGITLALAIPAAPGALGTYEFIGVVVLTSYGVGPDQALASVVLLRVVTTLPAVTLGLGAAWMLHLRPGVVLQLRSGRSTVGAGVDRA